MAEIEITLPTVQYGNVKVRATPEEFGFKLDEPSAFGMALAVYQAAFTLGWRDGSQMDVSAPVSASQSYSEEGARRLLEDGLGGVTEVAEYDSATEAKEAAQARTAGAAPWNNPQVDAKPKPWENKSAAPAKPVIDEGW